MKFYEKIDFLQDPQEANIFYANRFLSVLQKKSRNKPCLDSHDTYVLFRMFFSQVNNKKVFFQLGSPLNWEEFVLCQVRANETYSEAKRQFSDRNRDVTMNVKSANKWWSTLKTVVFSNEFVNASAC